MSDVAACLLPIMSSIQPKTKNLRREMETKKKVRNFFISNQRLSDAHLKHAFCEISTSNASFTVSLNKVIKNHNESRANS